jgi:hypothetical protein
MWLWLYHVAIARMSAPARCVLKAKSGSMCGLSRTLAYFTVMSEATSEFHMSFSPGLVVSVVSFVVRHMRSA